MNGVTRPIDERWLAVDADAAARGVRLDAFVQSALPDLSRRLVRHLIAEGAVRVNGRRAAKGIRLHAGDRVALPALPVTLEAEPELALRVAYEDEVLVVVDKPGGMPSHALDARQRGTVAAFLLGRYPETATVGDRLAPGLVHRLDTGTSGLLLAARTGAAHAALRGAFRRRTVEKRYLAVVLGRAESLDRRRVAVPLAHDTRDRRRMKAATAGERAWPAETAFEVLEVAGEHSLVQATMRTGVTHQIRVHLAGLGYPVLGDVLYGAPAAGLAPGRHALHAAALVLPHPDDGRALALACDLPADLRGLL